MEGVVELVNNRLELVDAAPVQHQREGAEGVLDAGGGTGVGLGNARSRAQRRKLRICRSGEQYVFVSQRVVETYFGGGALKERHALLDPHRDLSLEVVR